MINPGRMVLALQQNISKAVVGKEEAIEYALIALLCKGHVLIEDVPGVGKPRWPAPWLVLWTVPSAGFSSHPTSCLLT